MFGAASNHREVFNEQRPVRLEIKFFPKRFGIFAPRLEVLAVRMQKTMRFGALAASLFAIIKAIATAVQTSLMLQGQYLSMLISKEVPGAR